MNIFAIDHGNDSIKTLNGRFLCGLTKSKHLSPLVDEYIYYNGFYYNLSGGQEIYSADKTQNENYLIYTLFAMCQEEAKEKKKETGFSLDKPINLAMGLPPNDMESYYQKNRDYYMNAMGNDEGLKFNYCGEDKCVKLEDIEIYAQGYAAAFWAKWMYKVKGANSNNTIPINLNDYLIVDVGGGTCDIIEMKDNLPVLETLRTVEIGTIPMCNRISQIVKTKTTYKVERRIIEKAIFGQPTKLPDEALQIVKEEAQKHADEIIAEVKKAVEDVRLVQVVYIGGGTKLLKKYLENHTEIDKPIFISDQKANVKGYYRMRMN